jgi:hypothetical protein
MGDDSDGKPQGFTVSDRRIFAGGAESPAEVPAPPSEVPAEPPADKGPPAERASHAEKAETTLPPVDFTTFVLSLGSSALMHLGDVERPQTGKVEKDLALAKHTIDLLSMLQDKTKGNLTAQEAQLLESLLFDLRLRYVSAARPAGR